MKVGDVILNVNNRKVNEAKDIIRIIDEGLFKVGDSITLNVWRNGATFITELELEEPKSNQTQPDCWVWLNTIHRRKEPQSNRF